MFEGRRCHTGYWSLLSRPEETSGGGRGELLGWRLRGEVRAEQRRSEALAGREVNKEARCDEGREQKSERGSQHWRCSLRAALLGHGESFESMA